MTKFVFSIFRGLQVYVLSTSKRLLQAVPTSGLTCIRQPIAPPENLTERQRLRNTVIHNFRLSTMETIKKKGGRPPLADSQKKKIAVKINFDKGQYNLVGFKAKKAGLSIAEYCREASLENKISPILTPEQLDTLRKLSGMANNVNQIAYQANIGHLPDINAQAQNILNEMLSLIHQLKK